MRHEQSQRTARTPFYVSLSTSRKKRQRKKSASSLPPRHSLLHSRNGSGFDPRATAAPPHAPLRVARHKRHSSGGRGSDRADWPAHGLPVPSFDLDRPSPRMRFCAPLSPSFRRSSRTPPPCAPRCPPAPNATLLPPFFSPFLLFSTLSAPFPRAFLSFAPFSRAPSPPGRPQRPARQAVVTVALLRVPIPPPARRCHTFAHLSRFFFAFATFSP